MDNDESTELTDKLESIYEHRSKLGCPSVACPAMQELLLKDGADNAIQFSAEVLLFLAKSNIELNTEQMQELVIIASKNMAKLSAKCIRASFELCQACTTSKLMDGKDIQ